MDNEVTTTSTTSTDATGNNVNENIKNNTQVFSTGDWLGILILSAIPIVGIVMLFVWGFSGNTHPIKANYAKVALIVIAIGIVLSFILQWFFMRHMFSGMWSGRWCRVNW